MFSSATQGSPLDRRTLLQDTPVLLAVSGLTPSFAASKSSLSFLNWDAYIGSSKLNDFESETGASVNYGLFSDNVELFAKIRSSPG